MKVLFGKSIFVITTVVALTMTPWFCHAASLSPASVISAINLERQRHNLPELVTDQRLILASKEKISDMAANHYIDHVNPSGEMPWDYLDAAGYPYRAAGENIGKDFFNTSSVMNAWMASDTHRANIVSISFKDVGAAIGTVDGHTVIDVLFGATTLSPIVAGDETKTPINASDQLTQENTGSPTDQSATIIPNTSPEQNVTHSLAKQGLIQPFFTTAYLYLSIFAAITILAVFWRTS